MKIKLPHIGINSSKLISKIIKEMTYEELMFFSAEISTVLDRKDVTEHDIAECFFNWANKPYELYS